MNVRVGEPVPKIGVTPPVSYGPVVFVLEKTALRLWTFG